MQPLVSKKVAQQKNHDDDELMGVAFGNRPVRAYATLASFAKNEALPADAVVRAWYLVSRDLANHADFLPEATQIVQHLLMAREGDENFDPHDSMGDPSFVDADAVARVALAHLAGKEGGGDSVRKMADALHNRRAVTTNMRARIKETVRLSVDPERVSAWVTEAFDPEFFDDDEDDDDGPAGLRASYLIDALGAIDPRLELAYDVALSLVERFGRKNGDARLAANWAWRSGVEHDGVPQKRVASEAFVERYQTEPEMKKKRRHQRSGRK